MTTLNKIPDNSFTIRVKSTGIYLHIDKVAISLKERMNGCFVCNEDTAKDLLFKLKLMEYEDDLELVKFEDAYKAHGLIEKQMICN